MHDYLPPAILAATAAVAVVGGTIVAALCLTPSPVQAVMIDVVADFTFLVVAAVAASALIAAIEVGQ